nr:ATP-binding protein [uncultured Pseudodesulfovibrio sp.]
MADMQNVAISISQSGKSLVADDSLFIQAEGSLCYSLFANLIKNGVEASLANQQVTIDLIKTDIVTISVHNSGQVPDAVKNTFFDKYATANKTTGTGLGTYSAKLMTEAMGGTISLTTSKETGTTITVTLPCSTPSK